ncbi:Aspartic protein nepenthesin-2 precursor [Dorcoceras hygrometricum]|uniref:Aspartic protein nepenthesin-2 n=1 Tax=Dorcoceras hygrometricum TaxID=472368 RepID=A0A2Z7BFU4_9LAMI|nr:Aspartic protein nepenthesin-2 precursor [Dorcoceras hygrometricum]
MELLAPLFLYILLSRTSSSRVIQEVERLSPPVLHLPLYHVRGGSNSLQTAQPFSETLAVDEERVKFLNSRLDHKNSTTVHPVSSSILQGSESWIDEKSVKVPLNPGIPIGISNYYTKIGLGTPPTYYNVIIDTGSSFSWVQCEPCLVYCHPQAGSRFDPSASRTYQKLPCGTSQCSSLKVATLNSPMCTASNTCIYSATYGDQSFSVGYLSRDTLTFGSESLPGFVFGCGQDNNGLFGRSAGLIGLGKDSLSTLSQLSTKYGRVFSYCLPTSTFLGNTGSGGFLSIGTASNSAHKFTPLLAGDSSLYSIKLSAIYLSGKSLAVGSSGYSSPTIIDSGTTISRLSAPVYSALKQEFVKIVSTKYKIAPSFSILDACFYGTFDQISTAIPSVELIFQGGADLKLGPHNIIIEVEKGTTCLAFASSSGTVIIGNTQQQTFDITYDVASSRIGFAAGGCR